MNLSILNKSDDYTTYTIGEYEKNTLKNNNYHDLSIVLKNSEKYINKNPNIPTSYSQDTISDEFLNQTPIIANMIIDQTVIKQNNFVSLQKWEGYVISIENDIINARVIDLTTEGVEEIVQIYFDDIPNDDIDLVTPGAVFYWSIGYLDMITGQRIRSSIIKFRRLPQWTLPEIKRIDNEVIEIKEQLKWE